MEIKLPLTLDSICGHNYLNFFALKNVLNHYRTLAPDLNQHLLLFKFSSVLHDKMIICYGTYDKFNGCKMMYNITDLPQNPAQISKNI